jgi:FMN-dependent NADH-azoreductase
MTYLEEDDLSLLDSISEQDEYLRKEFGPSILLSRSALNNNVIRVFKRAGIGSERPTQIAEGEFRVITFIDRFGMMVHEVSFIESSDFLEKNKEKTRKSFWSKLCFWRRD